MAIGVLRHDAGLSERRGNRVGATPAAEGLIRIHRAATRGAALGQTHTLLPGEPSSRRPLRAGLEPGTQTA